MLVPRETMASDVITASAMHVDWVSFIFRWNCHHATRCGQF